MDIKKLLTFTLSLFFVISVLGVVFAFNTNTTLSSRGDGVSEVVFFNNKEVLNLSVPLITDFENSLNWHEGRVEINFDTLITLNELSNISWMAYVTQGYIPHVDVFLDNGEVLVFEWDRVQEPHFLPVENMTYQRNLWVNTFDDKGIVNDSATAWLNSGGVDPNGPNFEQKTLAEWKTENFSAVQVSKIEIEIDGWARESEAYIEDVKINGEVVESFDEAPVLEKYSFYPKHPNLEDKVTVFANFSDLSSVDSAMVRFRYTYVTGQELGPEDWPMIEKDGGLWAKQVPFTPTRDNKEINDGYLEAKFWANDSLGNGNFNSNRFTYIVTYDGTSPVTTANIVEDKFITSSTGISLTPNDPDLDDTGDYAPSGVNFTTYQIDNNIPQNYSGPPFNINGDDGEHTITFYSVDNAGNVESTKTVNVNLDNTAPNVEDNYDNDNVWVNSSQKVKINASDGEEGSGVANITYCLNGDCKTVNSNEAEVDLPDNAITTVNYFATDTLGQQSEEKSFVAKIDLVAPTTTESGASTEGTNQDVIVTLTCDDGTGDISGCKETFYSTDSSEPTTLYSGPFTLSATGEYQLKYYSTDVAGNQENVVTGTLVKIDKELPTITDDYANDGVWVNSQQTVTLTPQDTDSGIKNVTYCYGESCDPNILLEDPYQLTFDTSQDTIVRYQTFDVAGNPSLVGEFNVKIDLEIPLAEITSNSSTDRMDYFVVTADVSDTGGSKLKNVSLVLKSGGDVLLDVPMVNVLNKDYEYLLRMWDLTAGTYTIEVTAVDNAGNVNITTQTFEIESNVAPTKISSTNNKVSTETGGTVSFNFDVTVRNEGEIKFAIENIAGLTPGSLNARISDGTTNATVGSWNGTAIVNAEVLKLEDLDTEIPNVQGQFTLYLDFPKDMVPGNYPINYFIDIA